MRTVSLLGWVWYIGHIMTKPKNIQPEQTVQSENLVSFVLLKTFTPENNNQHLMAGTSFDYN